MEALLSLKGAADFVWCLPDSALYNSATVTALIQASLDHRLPLIGFSESFVRAGAVFGIYPDYRDIGRQAAELIQNYAAGRAVPLRQTPRMFRAAVNERVLRLMGLRYARPEPGDRDSLVVR